jgi:hypothetical protein
VPEQRRRPLRWRCKPLGPCRELYPPIPIPPNRGWLPTVLCPKTPSRQLGSRRPKLRPQCPTAAMMRYFSRANLPRGSRPQSIPPPASPPYREHPDKAPASPHREPRPGACPHSQGPPICAQLHLPRRPPTRAPRHIPDLKTVLQPLPSNPPTPRGSPRQPGLVRCPFRPRVRQSAREKSPSSLLCRTTPLLPNLPRAKRRKAKPAIASPPEPLRLARRPNESHQPPSLLPTPRAAHHYPGTRKALPSELRRARTSTRVRVPAALPQPKPRRPPPNLKSPTSRRPPSP